MPLKISMQLVVLGRKHRFLVCKNGFKPFCFLANFLVSQISPKIFSMGTLLVISNASNADAVVITWGKEYCFWFCKGILRPPNDGLGLTLM